MPMLMSVFTPTHDTRWIDDCYSSLLIQEGPDWEWVLVLTRELPVPLPVRIMNDPRVRVLEWHSNMLGDLKKFACDQSDGEILVELDSDDLLLPGTLKKIADQKDDGDFFYSDDAVFLDSGRAFPYHYPEDHGWTKYQIMVYGHPYWAMDNFEINARSLADIMYCPDHVRAWTRKAYDKVDGYDDSLNIGEDHDLMCRMYLSGARFKHIGGCGYLYRSHYANTSRVRNPIVGKNIQRTRDKLLYRLVEEWCRREKLPTITLQLEHIPKATALPFKDNSIGAYFAFDFLQMLDPQHVKTFMGEIYRTLVPGGWLCTYTPTTAGTSALQHYYNSAWNEASFWPYVNRHYAKYVQPCKARFQLVRCQETFSSQFHKQKHVKYMWADLCALKGQRQPGPIEI